MRPCGDRLDGPSRDIGMNRGLWDTNAATDANEPDLAMPQTTDPANATDPLRLGGVVPAAAQTMLSLSRNRVALCALPSISQ
jgi:hypothetical protein